MNLPCRATGGGIGQNERNCASMTDALLVGRTPTKLLPAQPPVVTDALFEADRVDGRGFEGVRFEHCTFANVSFKEASFTSCTFENCAFVECYFRVTKLDSSKFLGCKFVSCDFPKTSFRQCRFVYSTFRDCYVPYDVFEASLPAEANLRRQLGENLAREAEAAGASGDARLYRLQAYAAFEEYLRRGLLGSDEWSRQHFPSLPDRFRAGVRLVGRWINRHLWGYGERGMVLLRNAALLVVLLFPLLYYLARDGLAQSGGSLSTVIRLLPQRRRVPKQHRLLGGRSYDVAHALPGWTRGCLWPHFPGPRRHNSLQMDNPTMTATSEVWLFGSAARGDTDAVSDIDILVAGDIEPGVLERLEYPRDRLSPVGMHWAELRDMAATAPCSSTTCALKGKPR